MSLISKSIGITVGLFCLNFNAFSQTSSSTLNLRVTNSDFERVLLEYGKNINGSLKWSAGLSGGWSKDKNSLGVEEWTANLRTNRVQTTVNRDINLRIGLNKQIKEGPFSLGGNLVLGYNNADIYQYNSGSIYDAEKEGWLVIGIGDRPESEYTYQSYNSETFRMNTHTLRTGLQGNFNVAVPLRGQFQLNIFTAAYGGILTTVAYDTDKSPNTFAVNDNQVLFSRFENDLYFGVGVEYALK